MNDNIIRCQADGTWDFGDLRCEGKAYILDGKKVKSINSRFLCLKFELFDDKNKKVIFSP